MRRLNRFTYCFIFATAALAAGSGMLLAQSGVEELRLTVGKSVVIDYPTDIGRISTSNPDVVDSVAVTTREVLLHGKSLGAATVIVWAKSGERTFYNLNVEQNLDPLRRMLKESFPGQKIDVKSARDSISLMGTVSTKEFAERAAALAGTFAKTVVNNLRVVPLGAEKQIMLRVKFAELNRSLNRAFGINLLSTGALNTPGRITTGQFSPPSPSSLRGTIGGTIEGTTSDFSLTDALNIFAFRPDLNLAALIRALEGENILQILSEPNLVTTDGKEGSYLVGGEFPVPILQGGANAGAVTVQFKEFGNRLSFLPVSTENNTIKLYVKSEVSTIDLANSVTLQGFTIPALATRRAETNVELSEGQSFVIAGLIDDRESETLSRIPGLSSIPVLGALFRSRQENKQKTELVVIVTPEIVRPLDANQPHPIPVMPKPFLEPLPQPTSQNKQGAKAAAPEQAIAKKD